jgi:hypothetical protein
VWIDPKLRKSTCASSVHETVAWIEIQWIEIQGQFLEKLMRDNWTSTLQQQVL